MPDKALKEFVKNSINYDPTENLDQAEILEFFETSQQRTALIKTDKRIYCVLDDIKEDEPNINWSMAKKNVVDENNDLKLEITAKNYKNKHNTGLIHFGPKHKNWLFSYKRLGDPEEAADKIRKFIRS